MPSQILQRGSMQSGYDVRPIIILFIILGVLTILAGSSGGAPIEMDWDLADALASFVPNDRDEYFGYTVAFAGDVNGDGFDDILIGAFEGDRPKEYDCGWTYLFFGDPAGWSKNITTSDADASFYGEAKNDHSGWSIAGVGDINGDGLDDFIISSSTNYNDYAGRRGRAYLFYGNQTGWSLNTNLSSADQSFNGGNVAGAGDVNNDGYDDFVIGKSQYSTYAGTTTIYFGRSNGNIGIGESFSGEHTYDYSGRSVAGVGDVNGDGYDDILIGSINNDGGPASGKTYLIFGRESNWPHSLRTADAEFVGSPGDVTGGSVAGAGDVNGDGLDDFLIGAPYNGDESPGSGRTYLFLGKATGWAKNTSLTDADASFHGEAPGDRSGYSIATAGDVNDDGYDDILISSMYNNESGIDAGQTYLIFGKSTGWSLNTNLSNANASFLGERERGRAGIKVACNGDFNGDGNDDILIGAHNRKEGDLGFGKVYLVLFDDAPPELYDRTPFNATTGDGFMITINATDSLGVSNVSVEFWFADASPRTNVSMALSSGSVTNGTWVHNVTIAPSSTEPLRYFIHAMDLMDLTVVSRTRIVNVLDNDPPLFGYDSTPSSVLVGDELAFHVSVRDNIDLVIVSVEYWYGDTGPPTRVSMTPLGDQWTHTVTVPSDSVEILHYIFHARDSANLTAMTPVKDIEITDDELPVIGEDHTPAEATTGEGLAFSVEVFDNVEIGEVLIIYFYGEGVTSNVSLAPGTGDLWTGILTIEHTLEDLYYLIVVQDTYGNVMESPVWMVDVIDNDPPEIVVDMTQQSTTTSEPFVVLVTVRDNIGIASVKAVYSFGEAGSLTTALVKHHDGGDTDTYRLEIFPPTDTLGPLSYHFLVEDLYGVRVTGHERKVTVVDDIPPTIFYEDELAKALKGLPLTLEFEVDDNIGIASMHIVYWFGEQGPKNHTIPHDSPFELAIPRHSEGTLHFHFAAVDWAGNWATTEEFSVGLINVPPEIDDLPTWDVLEETDAEFDLAPYVTDPNDEVTVSCSDASITIVNMVLMLRHDAAVPDRTVLLTFLDGEDQTDADLTIHVVNVNDPPEIQTVSPEDGSKFQSGEKVTFNLDVSDEDLDELTVTWKDGDTILGTGETIVYSKLKTGTRTITVTVDDGTDKVEQSFTIKVTEEEGSPGPGLVAALAAVVLAVLVQVRRRGQRRA